MPLQALFCQAWPDLKFLLFTSYVPHLLYYSHLPAAIIALLLGFFVYYKRRSDLAAKILLIISIFFSSWIFIDILLWTQPDSRLVMFLWSLINLLEMLVTSGTLYFAYVFLEKKDAPLKYKIVIGVLLGIFMAFIPTSLNLPSFDIPACEVKQGPLAYYFYFLEILFFLWLLIYLIRKVKAAKGEERKSVAYFSLGAIFFLMSFSGANLAGSFAAFISPDNPNNWLILQYGLFGMPVFMAFLTYIIIKYKAFNIKLVAAQALVIGIMILIASQFAFIQNTTNRTLTAITLVIVSAFGWWLVRSVKKEVRQREELAKLNIDLEKSIKSRESLVHIINHKVKGSFTHSKYIFAEMLEGTYGAISPKLKELAAGGLTSDDEGIATIDMVLNQASLQAGTVKFDMKPFDFKKVVEEIIADKKGPAETKGLKLETEIKGVNYTITGDRRWLKEAAFSFVDNAVKYTDKGKIIVGLKLKEKQLLYYVKDTGSGITDEDKKVLWTEGGRGKNSLLKNVNSTGYGLSGTKKIVEAHKGKVWEESKVGKGSIFYMELPLMQK